jgi:hypothetical protein
LISVISMSLKSILIPLPHFFCPFLTYYLMSVIVVLIITSEFM